jgi:hypothetical protein
MLGNDLGNRAYSNKGETMKLKIYSIRDAKTEYFSAPFFNHTHGEAERNFKKACDDKNSNLNQFPEDYDLYCLGDYDDNSGQITPLDTPQHITKAVQHISKTH